MYRLILFGFLAMGFNANAQQSTYLFRSLPPSITGIDFKNEILESKETDVADEISFAGGGVAIGDINNDGKPDIVLVSAQKGPRLYLNKGNMHFEDITAAAGIENIEGEFEGVNIVDVDGDGWNDIFICKQQSNKKGSRQKLLLINNHNLTFSDRAEAFGITDGGTTKQALFFDFDNDGALDLLLLNSVPMNNSACGDFDSGHPLAIGFDVRDYLSNAKYYCWGPRLLLNRKNKFYDVTDSIGLEHKMSFPNSAVVCDINFDGYADILVCNDFITPNFLYKNNAGKSLTNVAPEYFKHTSFFTMGSDYADINKDGIPDFIMTDMLPATHEKNKKTIIPFSYEFYHLTHSKLLPAKYMTNCLFEGKTSPPFPDLANQAGVARTDWTRGILLQDFDNDGANDIYVTQGVKHDDTDLDYLNIMSTDDNPKYSLAPNEFYENLPTYSTSNFCFKNQDSLPFKDVTKEWGFGDTLISNGSAYADLDGDGDLDLVINNTDGMASVYENMANVIEAENHYIRFKLEGNNKNTAGLGSFIRIFYNHTSSVEYLTNMHGSLSSSEPIAHFGLGKIALVDSVECFWPGGDYQIFKNLRADSVYRLQQKGGTKKIYQPHVNKQNLAEEMQPNVAPITHKENYYVDFKHNRLQPFRLSTEGPCIATGDVNKDGLQDFFLGAAKGSNGQLWLQNKDGSFTLSKHQPWSSDATLENQGCVIADFNNDGWPDLLVANGSGENLKGDKGNILKLYYNDGNGQFIDTSGSIPQKDICYSSVAVYDFNGDGYLDILAAARLTPQSYPIQASSRLLVNNKGRFIDETDSLAPELNNLGNVRSVLWTDFDKDGKQDFIVAGEWMPITFFHNVGGKFMQLKDNPTVDSAFGLWTNIIEGDFDNDGDMDYIVCNYGTNSYLKATHDEPVYLYYDDFDDNGVYEPLVFHYLQDSLGILYDRNTFCDQMPKNLGKFPTYKSFANAKLKDFVSDKKMRTAKKFVVNEMRTSYIENLGNGKFKMRAMPADCQASAMYAALPLDINGDGNIDVAMIGNADVNLYQYAPMDGTSGVVLINDGKGNFKSVSADESGFKNEGYGRYLKLIDNADKKHVLLVANNSGVMKFFMLPQAKAIK